MVQCSCFYSFFTQQLLLLLLVSSTYSSSPSLFFFLHYYLCFVTGRGSSLWEECISVVVLNWHLEGSSEREGYWPKLRPNTLVPSYLVLPTMSKSGLPRMWSCSSEISVTIRVGRGDEQNVESTIGHDPHANIVHDLDISVQALHGGGESGNSKTCPGSSQNLEPTPQAQVHTAVRVGYGEVKNL